MLFPTLTAEVLCDNKFCSLKLLCNYKALLMQRVTKSTHYHLGYAGINFLSVKASYEQVIFEPVIIFYNSL